MKALSRATLFILGLFFFTLSFGPAEFTATDGTPPISIEECIISPIADRTYTGSEITPGITLMMGEQKIGSSNYTLTYKNNINAGTATVTATGTGNYCGSVSATFKIIPKNNTPKIFFENNKLTYNGKAQKPVITKITVGSDEKELSPSDYTVSYPDSVNVGTYTVTVTLKGNYNGQNTRDYLIIRELIENTQITLEKTSYNYTGSVIKPAVTITLNGITVKASDYSVVYSENKNAGTRNVHIEGKGNFKGSIKKQFTINTVSISDASVSSIADVTYTGSYQKPLPTVTWNGQTLANGKDYVLTYQNNLEAGTATVIITGCATANEDKTDKNFTGEKKVTFKINPLKITDYTIEEISDRTYTGSEIIPSVKLMKGESKLSSTLYTLSFKNNVNAGTATVTATGKGSCTGSISSTFKIVPKNNTPKIYLADNKLAYNGTVQKPVITKITVGTDEKVLSTSDYTVSYPDSKNAGTYTLTVTLKGNYNGQNTRTFYITTASIADAEITLEKASYSYTGKKVKPKVTVKYNGITLQKGTDYKLTYSTSVNSGDKNVLVEGLGNFKSSIKKPFTVKPVSLSSATVSTLADVAYTGSAHKPLPTVTWNGQTLANGKDYTLTYQNNLNAGTATVIITGCAKSANDKSGKNFTGEITASFKITPLSLADYTIEKIGNRTYTGSAITPSVKLMKGDKKLASSQYTLTFKNNVNAGTATVTATGTGNYTGTVSAKFKIVPKNNTPRIYLSETSFEYDGTAKKPKVTKVTVGTPEKKLDPSQYTVRYSSDRTNAGNYHVTVTLKNNYNGKNSKGFSITPMPVSKAQIKLSKRTYTYSGKAFKPTVTVTANGVTLKKDTDYKVYYSSNKLSGTGNVVIEGIGNYKGKSASQSFVIRKEAQEFKVTPKAKSFSLSYTKLKKAAQSLPVSKTLKITDSVGTVTYELGYSSAGYFTVDQATGAILVAKGTPKGTYELTLRLCASGNDNCMMCYRLADLVIVVK